MGGTVADGVIVGRGVRVGLGVGDKVGVGLVVGSGEIEGVGESITKVGMTAVGGSVGNGARYSSTAAQAVKLSSNIVRMMIFLYMFSFSKICIQGVIIPRLWSVV